MLRRLFTGALLGAVIFTPCLLQSAAKKNGPADLNLLDLDNRKVHLKDLRGKVVVVNFWATWCGPCNEEMPMLVETEKEWGPKGVTFIGASLDDRSTQKKIPDFMNRYQPGFAIWKGATPDDLQKLGLGQGVPDTVFVDEEGTIFARVLGQIKKEELLERLEWATGDRTKPAPAALLKNM